MNDSPTSQPEEEMPKPTPMDAVNRVLFCLALVSSLVLNTVQGCSKKDDARKHQELMGAIDRLRAERTPAALPGTPEGRSPAVPGQR